MKAGINQSMIICCDQNPESLKWTLFIAATVTEAISYGNN